MIVKKLPWEKEVTAREMRGVSGIYCFRHKRSHKRYFGSSKDIGIRFITHRSSAQPHLIAERTRRRYTYPCFFALALHRFGFESFVFTLVEKCSVKRARKREQTYINLFETDCRKYGFNSNRTNLNSRQTLALRKRLETIARNK